MTKADVIVQANASWRYWDPVMQMWHILSTPPTDHDDILVTGLDRNGEEVVVYFKTDRVGSWLGGTSG